MFRVTVITRLLFANDVVGSNVNKPVLGDRIRSSTYTRGMAHFDETPCLQSTNPTVYSCTENKTQTTDSSKESALPSCQTPVRPFINKMKPGGYGFTPVCLSVSIHPSLSRISHIVRDEFGQNLVDRLGV